MESSKEWLGRKRLEEEITSSKAALIAHKEGVRVHEIVLVALKKELKKLPPEKKSEKPQNMAVG